MGQNENKTREPNSGSSGILRHYTKYEYILKILRTKKLTLVKPDNWLDQNDREIAEYVSKKMGKSIYFQCYTKSSQKHHFWGAPDNCNPKLCIDLDYKKLTALATQHNYKFHKIDYIKDRDISSLSIKSNLDALFKKRNIYSDENEYRMVFVANQICSDFTYHVPIDLTVVKSITVSPFASPKKFDEIKHDLRKINGCQDLRVEHSRATNMRTWQRQMTAKIDTCCDGAPQ